MKKYLWLLCLFASYALGAASSEVPFSGMTKTDALTWVSQNKDSKAFLRDLPRYQKASENFTVSYGDLFEYGIPFRSGFFANVSWCKDVSIFDTFFGFRNDTIYSDFFNDLVDNLLNGRITYLTLNLDDFTPEALKSVKGALQQSSSLISLEVEGDNTQLVTQTVIYALNNCASLRQLKIKSFLQDDEVIDVATNLRRNSRISSFGLTDPRGTIFTFSGHRGIDAFKSLCDTVLATPTIKSLTLLDMPAEEDRAKAATMIIDIINQNKLTYIYLPGGWLWGYMPAIIRSLKENKSLRTLKTGLISHDSGVALIEMFSVNKTLKFCDAWVDIGGTDFTKADPILAAAIHARLHEIA